MSMPPDPNSSSGALSRIVKSEVLIFFAVIAGPLCIGLIAWMLSTMVDYGKAVTKLDGQIALLTSQIGGLTSQLQSEALTRYTAADAVKDLGYRDTQIKGLQDHLIKAEGDIDNLKYGVVTGAPQAQRVRR